MHAFFVTKKSGNLRLILDARPANQLHRAAPRSRLATPGALSGLNLSGEWAEISAEMLEAMGSATVVEEDSYPLSYSSNRPHTNLVL